MTSRLFGTKSNMLEEICRGEDSFIIRVTKAGDASLKVGQELHISSYLGFVHTILKYGGEAPMAVRIED